MRPPPPRYVPRKALPHATSVDSAVESTNAKPKPPIRTRKKKFFTTDDVRHPRQSEFVELSTSDVVVDTSSPTGELHVVPMATGVELKDEDTATTLVEVLEEREEGAEEGSDADLDKEEWEVIPDSAAGEDSNKGIMEEHCIQPNG